MGTRIYRPDSGTFDTELGPVFCNFLLADEINRAPAKVQSALLEVMQERQVTIGHESHAVPRPFLVLSGRPSVDLAGRASPFLPVVLLAAALNAFNKEVTYKASFLSVLVGPVGSRQALRMVAACFGIAHGYGIPFGFLAVGEITPGGG